MNNAFWDASIYADQQRKEDPYFAESDEGRVLYSLLERENQRLKKVLDKQKY